MAGIFPQEGRVNWINKGVGVGGADLKIRLGRNNLSLSDTTTLAAIQEANYDGYAAINSTAWSAPATQTNGDELIVSPLVVFAKSPGANVNTIYFYYITLVIGGVDYLLYVEGLNPPVPMVTSGDQCPIKTQLGLRGLTS